MPEENAPLTIHADSFRIAIGDLGVYVGLFEIAPQKVTVFEPADEAEEEFLTDLKAVVRIGPVQAKVLSIALKQALKDYEQHNGEIALPAEIAKSPGAEW